VPGLAVSRADYAAHHAVVDFLFRLGETPTGATCHVAGSMPWSAIDETDEFVKEAGQRPDDLPRKRNRAGLSLDNLSMERQDQGPDW